MSTWREVYAWTYTYSGLQPLSGKNFLVFKPSLVPPNTQATADLLLTKATLMTKADIDTAERKLLADLDRTGVIRLEKAHGLSVSQFARNLFRGFFDQAYTPENYIFLPPQLSGHENNILFPREYFDQAAATVAGVPVESPGNFPGDLQKALAKVPYVNPATILGIPYEANESGQYSLNLEKMNTTPLTDAAGRSWDGPTRDSITRLVAVITGKAKVYLDWKKKEAHYFEVMDQLNQLEGRFGSLEYDAQHRKDGQDLALWEKVVAMESEITGFDGKVSGDAGLSDQRKKIIVSNMEKLKYRLYYAKEMARNLRMRRPSVPSGPAGQPTEIPIEQVRTFYMEFKNAYESKNDSVVMSYISDKWNAGDGTTLFDLQKNLRNSFTVFDELRYNLANLNVTRGEGDAYRVSYDLTITGRIYRENLKNEEKSSVTES
jgi:hypothetical protein